MMMQYNWPINGRNYMFRIGRINSKWTPAGLGGIYIFAKRGLFHHRALFIGETDNLEGCLTPDHERWQDAAKMGAHEVHVLRVDNPMTRVSLERSFIQVYAPPVNKQYTF